MEAGWRIMRSRRSECAALRSWATKIAVRRGKRVAVVALARRLTGILYAMWRDGSDYRVSATPGEGKRAAAWLKTSY